MAKAPAAVEEEVVATTNGRPGTMHMQMTDAEYDALPAELKNQISKSPAPKDSIGYYFDQLVAELKGNEEEAERQFNVKDVLLWCYQKSDNKVFKIQSVRTVLKKRLQEEQIIEATGVAGRDKVYQVVA
jgi:hypothetical protein